MDYQLHRNGTNVGSFSLEELRRRRQAGELTGAEYVWREGMADWEPIDSVLAASPGPVAATPPPLPQTPRKRASRKVMIIAVAVITVAVIGLTAVGYGVFTFISSFKEARERTSGKRSVAVSAQKVEWTGETKTDLDTRKRGAAFRRRLWLEAYKENGNRNHPFDAEAPRMIEAWIASNFGEPGTNAPDFRAWFDRIASGTECDDPLLLTLAGLNAPEVHEKNRRLERALAGFANSRHGAYPRLNAAVMLIDNNPDTNRVRELFRVAGATVMECFRDGSFRPQDQDEIAEIFIHGWAYNYFSRARSTIHRVPQTSGRKFEWLALVFTGEYHVMEAWSARGSSWADSVTEKGWQGFQSHLAAARKNFTRAWELRPDLPLAPARMISVAMGDSNAEEMRKWFDRAVAAQVDYAQAWSSLRWGLRPRWHGSHEAMLELGRTAIKTARFDTDVPRKYFDVITDLEEDLELPFGTHIYARPDIWPDLQRMYEGYIADETQAQYRDGWRSTFAAVARMSERYDVARLQLEALDWQPHHHSLSGWGADLSLMAAEIAARTGSAKDKVTVAENAHEKGKIGECLKLYQDLAQGTDLDERTAHFVHHRIGTLKIEERLSSGEWIDLLPTGTNDPAWVTCSGMIRRTGDRSLEIAADKFGHMGYSRARMGPAFEIRGKFEVLESSTEDFQAGLVFGQPDLNARDWYSFRMKRNGEEGEIASFSSAWSKQQVAKPVKLNRSNEFQFQYSDGEASATVNGTPVLTRGKLRGKMRISPSECYVGVGAYNDMNDTTIRYTHVQVRRLPSNSSTRANR